MKMIFWKSGCIFRSSNSFLACCYIWLSIGHSEQEGFDLSPEKRTELEMRDGQCKVPIEMKEWIEARGMTQTRLNDVPETKSRIKTSLFSHFLKGMMTWDPFKKHIGLKSQWRPEVALCKRLGFTCSSNLMTACTLYTAAKSLSLELF